jgi:hypothetical protein
MNAPRSFATRPVLIVTMASAKESFAARALAPARSRSSVASFNRSLFHATNARAL